MWCLQREGLPHALLLASARHEGRREQGHAEERGMRVRMKKGLPLTEVTRCSMQAGVQTRKSSTEPAHISGISTTSTTRCGTS